MDMIVSWQTVAGVLNVGYHFPVSSDRLLQLMTSKPVCEASTFQKRKADDSTNHKPLNVRLAAAMPSFFGEQKADPVAAQAVSD